MKFIFCTLLSISAFAQASTFNCVTRGDEGQTILTVDLSSATIIQDPDGSKYESRSFVIKKENVLFLRGQAIGPATDRMLQLTLVNQQDLAVGLIDADLVLGNNRILGLLMLDLDTTSEDTINCFYKK